MVNSTIYLAETDNRARFVDRILEKFWTELGKSHNPKVFVKPNIVSREPYPTTTHPQILASVLDFLLYSRCQIVVADGPAVDAGNSESIISNHPLTKVCNERGIELQNLHKCGFKKVKAHSMSLEISTLPFECDCIISLPVLKPHKHCHMTGALKNQFGFLRNRERVLMHTKLKSLNKGIAKVNSIVRPSLFVVDAIQTYTRANEKRHGGQEVRLGYMLAGKDPVALDSFGLELLKRIETSLHNLSPENVAYLAHAFELGLGNFEYDTEQVPGV